MKISHLQNINTYNVFVATLMILRINLIILGPFGSDMTYLVKVSLTNVPEPRRKYILDIFNSLIFSNDDLELGQRWGEHWALGHCYVTLQPK